MFSEKKYEYKIHIMEISGDTLIPARNWLIEIYGDDGDIWFEIMHYFTFKDAVDAMAFKLRWT